MIGWHRWLNGHELEQIPGDSGGQGCLVCWSTWCQKESDTNEGLNEAGKHQLSDYVTM